MSGRHGVQYVAQCVVCAGLTLVVRQSITNLSLGGLATCWLAPGGGGSCHISVDTLSHTLSSTLSYTHTHSRTLSQTLSHTLPSTLAHSLTRNHLGMGQFRLRMVFLGARNLLAGGGRRRQLPHQRRAWRAFGVGAQFFGYAVLGYGFWFWGLGSWVWVFGFGVLVLGFGCWVPHFGV